MDASPVTAKHTTLELLQSSECVSERSQATEISPSVTVHEHSLCQRALQGSNYRLFYSIYILFINCSILILINQSVVWSIDCQKMTIHIYKAGIRESYLKNI